MSVAGQSPKRWLLYDGECGFCQQWCQWAKRRGAEPAVIFQACQSAVELRQRAGIRIEDCGRTAFLIETRDDQILSVRRSAAAINGVLANLPGRRNALWRGVSKLYRIPGLKSFEELGYRIIAKNRSRLGSKTCKMR